MKRKLVQTRVKVPYTPFYRQRLAHKSEADVLLFGGAMHGGKTYWICGDALDWCLRYPGNRIAIVRKTRTALKRTTWITLLKIIPKELIAQNGVNQTELSVKLINGSMIFCLGADTGTDPLLEELKSLEVSFAYIEEASQVAKKVFEVLSTRVNRWVCPNGIKPRGGLRLTTNPEIGWVKETFIDKEIPDNWEVIQSLPGDNPYGSDVYMKVMKQILSENDQQRYLDGLWTAPEDPNRLISYELVKAAMDGAELDCVKERWISVDVAYEGDDNSEIWVVEFDKRWHWQARHLQTLKHQNEDTVADAANKWYIEFDTDARIIVDANGIGSGVATILKTKHHRSVVRFKGGMKAVREPSKLEFRNLRDQSYWALRQDLAEGKGFLPEDPRLAEEITSLRYKVQDKKVEIERKLELKKRLGRSPDKADALTMGIFAPRIKRSQGGGVAFTNR